MAAGLLAGCGSQTAEVAEPEQTEVTAAAETSPAQEAAPVEETASAEETQEMEAGQGPEVDLGALLDEAVPLAGAPALSTVLSPVASGTAVQQNQSAVIDYSNAKDGYVMVKWLAGGTPKLKVLVKGPSGTTYQYNLRTDGQFDTFPLSDGSGSYTVGVYQNTSGTQYATILTAGVKAQLVDEFAPFIRPNQYVTYTAGSKTVAKAAEICAGAPSNLDKVSKVYNYVINNTVYDKQKAQTVKSGYLPNVDETLATGKGICFDYAALMSAMLRSQGVPVKLVVGYTDGVYHAWINVYSEKEGWIDGKIYFDGTQWKLMDPTFASSGKQSDAIMQYIGNGDNYTAKYLY
jgi:hypothetical protein